ncbi:patatin-like phospholipase family protein [Angustibacter peucedani]
MSDPLQHNPSRALVLGGGGSAGNAWLIGVVAGLLEGGLDVTDADLVVGTSAGATAAAQLTSADPAALLAEVLVPVPAGGGGPRGGRAGAGRGTDHQARTAAVIAQASDQADLRRRLGQAALALEVPPGWPERWRAVCAARLPQQAWPGPRLWITAIDARTGEPVVLDRDSGVDLADAVAASTASAYPFPAGGRSLLDGGYRTNADNADLATGHDRVLVLSPFGGRARTPETWGHHLASQVEALRQAGSRVETVFPDAAARQAFGEDAMDVSVRAPVAQAGRDQGRALAEPLSALWNSRMT